MEYSLRPYQQKAVDFAIPRLKTSKKPLLMCLGTGAGKSWQIAETAKRWGGNALVLTATKELCQQDYDKMVVVAGEDNVGIFSASLGKKEVKPITIATIQSAVKEPELWKNHELLIADECDVMPIDGMLGKLYNIGDKKLLGLTATPYATVGSRKGSWYTTKIWPMHKIKSKEMGWFWQPTEFSLSEKELISQGYLCPMKLYSSPTDCHLLKLASNGSEYTQTSLDAWVEKVFARVVQVMMGATKTNMCRSGIVFMPSVEACNVLERLCGEAGLSARAISYETDPEVRNQIVDAHRAGKLQWLINQGIATRGFDNPMVDCLVIARPTNSLRLHRQILGRGLRLADNKDICSVLDLTENCVRWGGPEDVEMGHIRVNGFMQDTIMLRGKDISGMETGKINLARKRKTNE